MKITHLRTNHIENPLGFTLDTPRVSWQVIEAEGSIQKAARVETALDEEFASVIYDSGWKQEIDSLGTELPIELQERTRYYWRVSVESDMGELAVSENAWFETGRRQFTGQFITADTQEDFPTKYTKEFYLERMPVKARAYACGLGFYELYLNGEKAGEEYLAPGLNDYDSWIQTQTYDVLPFLKPGENRISALTADGLYKGRFGFEGGRKNIYGDRQCFLCDLIVTYENGEEEIIATDSDWQITKSKIQFADIYDGEILDDTVKEFGCYAAVPVQIGMEKLMPRLSLPVKVKEKRKPVAVLHAPNGDIILDMGQNMVGWPVFHNRMPYGTKISLMMGEILQDGCFYNDNLRIAKQEFVYISDGQEKEVRPHFTFYGFRYIKIQGIDEVDKEDFTGYVLYSDLELTGNVETSNPLVNRLFQNTLWGQKGNYVDVPTDCPQRDERMGWTGDAQVFCATAAFHMDIFPFMKKYCHDMKLEQRKQNGVTPMVVPAVGMKGGGCCAWADAATIIPWTVYEYSGDKGILEESYEGMKSWADYICRQDEQSGNHRLWTTGFHFGDWLAMDGENPDFPTGGTEIPFISSCYYLISVENVSKAAAVLGKKEDAESYARRGQEIREAISKEYITPAGRLALTNQTAYCLALYCELAEGKKKARLAEDLFHRLEKDHGYLKTGFVGTPLLCRMLSENGYNQMAYQLLLNEELPSWLYCVKMGATTIWERWNSVMPDGHMNPEGMNSLNHYSYGAIAEWMYRNMGGINQTQAGFRKVRIAPMPDPRIEQAEVSYLSAMGKIESCWKYDKENLLYTIALPFGVSGEIRIRVEEGKKVWINNRELSDCGCRYRLEDDLLVVEVRAGKYEICVA